MSLMRNNIHYRTVFRVVQIAFAILAIQWVAFYFDIQGTSTAVMSAIVVTQTFVGGLYHKATNRVYGTILGLSAGLILTALFPESPRTWLALTLLWLGSMTFIASIVHSDRAYLFLLAGYTFAFVGFPVLVTPEQTWLIFHNRATNVLFGILVMILSSVVIFPLYQKRHTVYPLSRLYHSLLSFNRSLQHGRVVNTQRLRHFLAGISSPIFHRQSLRYEYQLSRREVKVMDSYLYIALRLFFYSCLLSKCSSCGGAFFTRVYADFQQLLAQLKNYKKYRLHPPAGFRFYTVVFHQHTDMSLALRRAVRTVITTLLMLYIWYLSAWSAGQVMMTFAVIYIVLLSSARLPEKIGVETLNGTLQGILLACIWLQYVYSSLLLTQYPDLYFPAQLPVIFYGAQMLAREAFMLRGITLLTTFYFVAPPLNVQTFDYHEFINNATGCFAGMLGFVLGINLILPEKRTDSVPGLFLQNLRELRHTLSHPSQYPADKLILLYDRWMRFSVSDNHREDLFALIVSVGSLQLLISQWQQDFPDTWATASAPLRSLLERWLLTNDCRFTPEDEERWCQQPDELKKEGDPARLVLSLARQFCQELERIWLTISGEQQR